MNDEPIAPIELVKRYGNAMPLTAHAALHGDECAIACLRVAHARVLGRGYAASRRHKHVEPFAYAARVADRCLRDGEGAPAEIFAQEVGVARFAEISGVATTEHASQWLAAFDRGYVEGLCYEVSS